MADVKQVSDGVTADPKGNWVEVRMNDGTTVKVTRPSLTVPPAPQNKPVRKPDQKRKNQGNGPLEDFGFSGGDPKRRRMKVGDPAAHFVKYAVGTPNIVATGYYDPEETDPNPETENSPVADAKVVAGILEPLLPNERIRMAFWDHTAKQCHNTAFWVS